MIRLGYFSYMFSKQKGQVTNLAGLFLPFKLNHLMCSLPFVLRNWNFFCGNFQVDMRFVREVYCETLSHCNRSNQMPKSKEIRISHEKMNNYT